MANPYANVLPEHSHIADAPDRVHHCMMAQARILIVEDEPLIRMFVVDSLEDAGFHVEESGSAAEAMAKMIEETPSFMAVIVDIGLPDRPGDLLALELRNKWTELPIIIASGQDRSELAKRFKHDDLFGVLAKPYNSQMLLEALGKIGVSARSV